MRSGKEALANKQAILDVSSQWSLTFEVRKRVWQLLGDVGHYVVAMEPDL